MDGSGLNGKWTDLVAALQNMLNISSLSSRLTVACVTGIMYKYMNANLQSEMLTEPFLSPPRK